jgi:hypothetical protein
MITSYKNIVRESSVFFELQIEVLRNPQQHSRAFEAGIPTTTSQCSVGSYLVLTASPKSFRSLSSRQCTQKLRAYISHLCSFVTQTTLSLCFRYYRPPLLSSGKNSWLQIKISPVSIPSATKFSEK